MIGSLPSRERGLKSIDGVVPVDQVGSLPSRERGLKSGVVSDGLDAVGRSLHGSVD